MIIIKRDGTEEKFSKAKLKKLAMWACNDVEAMAQQLIDDTASKLRPRTRSETLMRHLTETAANLIGLINPDWQFVAEKLYLLDTYHKKYPKIKFHKGEYPLVQDVFTGAGYGTSWVKKYSAKDLEEINTNILKQERDLIFTYSGLYYMLNKYSMVKELPQHTYMRAAMFLAQDEPEEVRLQEVKTMYDSLSTHKITLATPVMLNSGRVNPQMASCVLMKADDTTESITDTNSNVCQYSRYHGGISVDVTAERARGSKIKGNLGESSGPVAFIKMIESAITAFSQGGCFRKGQLIQTVNRGIVKIEDLIPDVDEVISSRGHPAKITNVFATGKKQMYRIKHSVGHIDLSADHRVAVMTDGDTCEYVWKRVRDLKQWDHVVWLTNQYKGSRDVTTFYATHLSQESTQIYTPSLIHHVEGLDHDETYDVSVAGTEELFVNGMLVHNSRKGAANITFDWWHKDVLDLVALKRNDGTDEERARHLKYTIRMNKYLYDAEQNDEEVYLFDPKLVPGLNESWGDEWLRIYNEAITNNVPHAKIRAKELMFEILKTRTETGNLYMFFTDNVNEQTPLKDRFINASNLCNEIYQPSYHGSEHHDEIVMDMGGKAVINSKRTAEEISLCTLGSIDLSWFDKATIPERVEVIGNMVRGLDNTFDLASYPAKGAEFATKQYRYLGIGVFNYAKMLAENKLKFDDPKALEFVEGIFELLQLFILSASKNLGEEKGVYPAYKSIHGVQRRNALLQAVAPTACRTKDSKTILASGEKVSLEEIMDRNFINHTKIEESSAPRLVHIEPLKLDSRYGPQTTTKIWYNGKAPTRTITFADGHVETFSLDHMLLASIGNGDHSWTKVRDLATYHSVMRGSVSDKNHNLRIHAIMDDKEPQHTWDFVVDGQPEYYLSNWIVSHNSSVRVVAGTESSEPIKDVFVRTEATISLPWIAPDFKKLGKYYQKAFDIDPHVLIDHAAARQKYLDQGQSVNMYMNEEMSVSAKALNQVHRYALDKGLKGLYYCNTLKEDADDEPCESCT